MKFIHTYLLTLLTLFFILGCQEEYEEISLINTDEVITTQAALFKSIKNISLLDGSSDDLLDIANCFQIKLPVTINVGTQNIEISSPDDFIEVENTLILFQKIPVDIEFNYPIQIILSEYTSININGSSELDQYKSDCITDGSDNDIECIDFIYPFNVYTYNANLEKASNETLNSDQQLFQLLNGLDSLDLWSIDYPITVYTDGLEITVDSNAQLENIIDTSRNTCDENDLFIWEPATPEFIQILTEGNWIATLFYDKADLSEQLVGIDFTFSISGAINTNSELGEWNSYLNIDSLMLSISFDSDLNLNMIKREWNVISYGNDEIVLQHLSGGTTSSEYLIFNRTTSNISLKTTLQSGSWKVTQFIDASTDETDKFIDYSFTFSNSDQLTITDGIETITGFWLPVSDVFLVLDIEDSPFSKLRNDWQVSSYDANQVILNDISDGSTLVFSNL